MQAPVPARSPLSEMQLPPAGSQSKLTPKHTGKSSPIGIALLQSESSGQTPTAEDCMSPVLCFAATPGSAGGQLRRGPKHAGRGAGRKTPTPNSAGAKHAAKESPGNNAPQAGKHGVPDVEASLCNLHGSPLSPSDLGTADRARKLPAMSSLACQSAAGRETQNMDEALQSTAASPFQAAAGVPLPGSDPSAAQNPGGGAGHRGRRVSVPGLDPLPEDSSPLASPALMEGASSPRVRGARPRVPSLNLSGSLRISVEATTPPCSFPLRGKAAEAPSDRRFSACSARSLSSDEEDERFNVQATYQQAAPPDSAHAARIGTSKLAQPRRHGTGDEDGWGPPYNGGRGEAEDSDAEGSVDYMPTARSTEQAVYELGSHGGAKGSSILEETSTFLAARTPELPRPAPNRDALDARDTKQQDATVPSPSPAKAQVNASWSVCSEKSTPC